MAFLEKLYNKNVKIHKKYLKRKKEKQIKMDVWDFEGHLNQLIKGFKVCGLWQTGKYAKYLKLYSLFVIINFSIFSGSLLHYVLMYDKKHFIKTSYIGLAPVAVTIKAFYLFSKNSQLRDTINGLFEARKHLPKIIKFTDNLYINNFKHYQLMFITFIVDIIILHIFMFIRPLVLKGQTLLVCSEFYGIEYKSSTIKFLAIYLFEVFATIAFAPAEIFGLFYLIFYICTLAAWVEIIGNRIKCIKFEKIGEKSTEQLKELQNCIDQYLKLQDIRMAFEKYFVVPVFVQFVFDYICLCTNIYYLSDTSITTDVGTYLFYVGYILTFATQLLIPCWFGHGLQTRSEELLRYTYECDWYKGDREFKTRLMFLMLYLKKPITFKVYYFFRLDLPAFLKVSKISIEIYFF